MSHPIDGQGRAGHRRQPRARPRRSARRWRARARGSCWWRANAERAGAVVAAIRAAGGEAHAIAADVGDKRRHPRHRRARPPRWSAPSTS